MSSIVVYSTLTGNTKKVAENIAIGMNTDAVNIDEFNTENLSKLNLIAIGGWLDKGHLDDKTLNFINAIPKNTNLKIAVFCTLGGNPNSERAKKFIAETIANIQKLGVTIIGSLLIQGKVDPKLVALMEKNFPQIKEDPEHIARIAEAATHPNITDCEKAQTIGMQWKQYDC